MTTIRANRITPEGFARYGKVARLPSGEPTAAAAAFTFWSDVASYQIEGETEIGFCTVYRQDAARVPWMERHLRTPELLIPIDAPFILPVMPEDAPGSGVEAFRVDVGEAVVIGTGVWHSACHPAEGDAATYFVVFRRGTPREDVTKKDVADVVVEG
jgi:ureidoglycolate hydrolase